MATFEQRQAWWRRAGRKYQNRLLTEALLAEDPLGLLEAAPILTSQLHGVVGGWSVACPEQALYCKELAVLFSAAKLPQTHVLLSRLFGYTHQEIGYMLDVSRARAHQVEQEGWAAFRRYLENPSQISLPMSPEEAAAIVEHESMKAIEREVRKSTKVRVRFRFRKPPIYVLDSVSLAEIESVRARLTAHYFTVMISPGKVLYWSRAHPDARLVSICSTPIQEHFGRLASKRMFSRLQGWSLRDCLVASPAWWCKHLGLVLSEQVVQILSKHELYPLWPNFLEELRSQR